MWHIVRLASSRVATRHSSRTPHFDQDCDSSRTIYHIYYILQCAKQDKRAAFSIPVKSVSFKSFDYRRHRACAIARLVPQLGHIIFIPNAASVSSMMCISGFSIIVTGQWSLCHMWQSLTCSRCAQMLLSSRTMPDPITQGLSSHLRRNLTLICVLDWPACSPDINLIEHVWDQLSCAVHQRLTPEHNLCHVRQFLQEEWDRLTQANIRTLVTNVRAHVAACIDARLLVPLNTEQMYSWIITFVISCVHVGICNFQCITPPVFSSLYVA